MFESVGRLSSVQRGAAECNLSQPAVSQSIRKLEQIVGETLLERQASGSYLTAMGEIFHQRVRNFQQQFNAALTELGVGTGYARTATIAHNISRSQIRCLIAAREHGSLQGATEALGLTQASLQRALRELEEILGRSVIHRNGSGVMFTARGHEFGRRMKLACQEIEWGVHEVRAARGIEESTLTIGALPFGGSMLLASVLDGFVGARPSTQIQIVTEGATEMVKRLRSGEVDLLIGLVQESRADDLDNVVLSVTPYQVVCRTTHPLARKARISIEDLLEYEWVVGTEGSSRRLAFENLFSKGRRPRAHIAASSLPIVRHLLHSADRLALVTSYELGHENNRLTALDFERICPSPSIGITLRAGWTPTRLHKAFIGALRESVDSE